MPDRLPSLDLLLGLVQGERDKQLAHFDALDAKAGVAVAFAGLLVTLAPDMSSGFRIPGVLFALTSAGFAFSAFWPRRFPVLEPSPLRGYLRAEVSFAKLTVLDTLEDLVNAGSEVLQEKGRRLRFALMALVLGAAAFGAGTVVEAL